MKNSMKRRHYGMTLNQRKTELNMLSADMKNKRDN